jgi:N,N-dimethylformamidase
VKLLGYSDPLTARPGDRVSFMVSSLAPRFTARLVRLIHGDPDPAGPGIKMQPFPSAFEGEYDGMKQSIPLGSEAHFPDAESIRALTAFTVALWVYPTAIGDRPQTILSKGSLFSLGLEPDSALVLQASEGNKRFLLRGARPLRKSEWFHITVKVNSNGEVTLAATPGGLSPPSAMWRVSAPADVRPSLATAGPLVLARSFNGKLGSLALRDDRGEIVAAWHFGLEPHTDRIIDTGPLGLHGTTVNMPTRAVTGAGWTGHVLNCAEAPDEYDAIYFHDDDLEDAGWQPSFDWRIPEDMPSGIYAAALEAHDAKDWVPFFVCPPRGQARHDVAFLAPVLSYLAYVNEHYMADPVRQTEAYSIERALARATPYEREIVHAVLENRLHSLYDIHSDGSGVCYSSARRPLLTMRPGYNKASLWFDSPHQLNEDLCLTDWLEQQGQGYDVLTDQILHHDGVAALAPYRVLMTGSHPEYWSEPMLDAVEAFLANGGRLMYLGGNGLYWVTTIDPARPHVIEVRRGFTGTRMWGSAPGEGYHSTTGEPGGIWRLRGRPPQKLVGVGFTAQGQDRSAPYRRRPESWNPRAQFIFEGVEGDVFGAGGLHLGAAGGYEMDRADVALGTPPHALVLASSFGHSDNYQHCIEEMLETDGLQGGTRHPAVRSDLVFFEHPGGGAVFSVGSISWSGSLSHQSYDGSVSRITGNVLRRFLDPQPFPFPDLQEETP